VIGRAVDEVCRKLVSRARRRVADHEPRIEPAVDRRVHRRLVERFVVAAGRADVDGLVMLLAEDVRLVSDGGPDRRAARNPIIGRISWVLNPSKLSGAYESR
jgi:RNA polymerase sigma-70 factor (ECF subfamily)